MNKTGYNIQNLRAYLLDSLPAEEIERFDELSFTDDEFADQLNSAEKDLIDEYVRGELSGATLEKFESHYLASPLRRERIEFAKAFQTYGERNAEEIRVENKETKQAGFFSFLNIFAARPILQFGFAAVALAFVILGGVWIFKNRGETEMAKQNTPAPINQQSPKSNQETPSAVSPTVEKEIAQANVNANSLPEIGKERTNKSANVESPRVPKPKETPTAPRVSIAAFLLAPALRGTNKIQTVSIPDKTTGVEMRLRLEADEYKTYRVVLKDQTGEDSIWQSGALKSSGAAANKILNVRFPARFLKSQIYSLQVAGINADGEFEIISDYSFRVVR